MEDDLNFFCILKTTSMSRPSFSWAWHSSAPACSFYVYFIFLNLKTCDNTVHISTPSHTSWWRTACNLGFGWTWCAPEIRDIWFWIYNIIIPNIRKALSLLLTRLVFHTSKGYSRSRTLQIYEDRRMWSSSRASSGGAPPGPPAGWSGSVAASRWWTPTAWQEGLGFWIWGNQ